jgi:hypothetical protein
MGARPSAFSKPVVEAVPVRVWSEAQETIFKWFEMDPESIWLYSSKHLCILARAGTGKSTTILEGVNRAPESSILLCAFNKRIADELNTRTNPNAEAKTLHALGYQMVVGNGAGCRSTISSLAASR